MGTLLTVENLGVVLDNQVIIEDVSFDVEENETLAVIGPNGAGKTTLFRAILGLIPYTGKVNWKKGVKIGYVPQKLYIDRDLPLTVREFFDLRGVGVISRELSHFLSIVGFEGNEILGKRVGVLSGGEMQRVLIAWALCNHPNVLLFDEPTSGVDVSAEVSIYSLLNKLHNDEKFSIILISHELQIVDRYATKVICLNKNKVCYGAPREVLINKNLSELFGGDISLYHHH